MGAGGGSDEGPGGDAGSWKPANEAEDRLRAAVAAGDLTGLLGLLATVPLFLPGFRDTMGAPVERQRLLTRDRDGVPYLPVFTSPESLHRTVTADGWRQTRLAELARSAPVGFGLAINPGTPIAVVVPPGDVPGLVPDRDDLAAFEPANDRERALRDALGSLGGEPLLDLLVTAQVMVPARPLVADGLPMVPVFTSARRRADFIAGRDLDLPTVTVDLVAVLRAWPDPECWLAVNPGSPIAFSVRGDRVPGLLAYAVELAQRGSATDLAAIVPGEIGETPGDGSGDPVPGGRAGLVSGDGPRGRVPVVPTPRASDQDIADLLRGARPPAESGEEVPPRPN